MYEFIVYKTYKTLTGFPVQSAIHQICCSLSWANHPPYTDIQFGRKISPKTMPNQFIWNMKVCQNSQFQHLQDKTSADGQHF